MEIFFHQWSRKERGPAELRGPGQVHPHEALSKSVKREDEKGASVSRFDGRRVRFFWFMQETCKNMQKKSDPQERTAGLEYFPFALFCNGEQPRFRLYGNRVADKFEHR